MRLYRARDTAPANEDGSAEYFCAGLKECRVKAKEKFAPDIWTDIEVAEVIVNSTKAGLLLAIEGRPEITKVVRAFRMNRKGMLVGSEDRKVI